MPRRPQLLNVWIQKGAVPSDALPWGDAHLPSQPQDSPFFQEDLLLLCCPDGVFRAPTMAAECTLPPGRGWVAGGGTGSEKKLGASCSLDGAVVSVWFLGLVPEIEPDRQSTRNS